LIEFSLSPDCFSEDAPFGTVVTLGKVNSLLIVPVLNVVCGRVLVPLMDVSATRLSMRWFDRIAFRIAKADGNSKRGLTQV